MLKKQRIKFRGRVATRGTCQCGKVLIIEEPDPAIENGKFRSYHQPPLCPQYLEIVGSEVNEGGVLIAESEYIYGKTNT